MKIFTSLVMLTFLTSFAYAKTWNLNKVIQEASPNETENLLQLLSDISLEPYKTASGKSLSRVKSVKAGSIYDKAGIKIGDFVDTGLAEHSQQMEVKAGQVLSARNSGRAISKEEARQIEKESAETFEKAFNNSSPEEQKFILESRKRSN